jgi:hypothetical protein
VLEANAAESTLFFLSGAFPVLKFISKMERASETWNE